MHKPTPDTLSIFKLDVQHPHVQARAIEMSPDDYGRIPDNLAALTATVVALHRANGDMGWLADMCWDDSLQDIARPNAVAMALDLQACLADPNCPDVIRELLVKHDLLS